MITYIDYSDDDDLDDYVYDKKIHGTLCPTCGNHSAEPYHECPYNMEIGDGLKLCRCCDSCRRQCAEDV